jgi:hypothetical protein
MAGSRLICRRAAAAWTRVDLCVGSGVDWGLLSPITRPRRGDLSYPSEWDNRSWQTRQRSSPQPQGHSRRQRHPSQEQMSKKKVIRIPQLLGEVYAQRLDQAARLNGVAAVL